MGEETKRKPHRSTRGKTTAPVLVLVLGLFVTFFGLIFYGSLTATGFCGSLGAEPCPGREALNIISSTLNSPTNITVQISNTGSVAITLMAYHVKNSNGRVYSSNNWVGTDHQSECYQKQHSTDRWKHVHIPIRFLLHHHADNIAKQRLQPHSQNLARALCSQAAFYHATNNSRSPCNLLLLAE